MRIIHCMFLLLAGAYAYGQTPVSVFGYPYFDQSVTQAEINNAGPVFSQQSVTLPATQNYVFNGNSDKEIRATSYIKIEGSNTGFKAGPYTGTGKMKLTVGPSPFDVAVMNYNGLNHVVKYEKLELGVALPADILAKVNNFVNNIEGQKLNPFLEWELKVQAVFTHPNEPEPIVIDGFYIKEFESWMVGSLPEPANGVQYHHTEYMNLGGWTEQSTPYPFRVRFSPPHAGIWNAYIRIIVSETQEIVTPSFEFNTFDEGSHGYVTVGDDKRYMRLDGNSFYPVGCNISWPETKPQFDNELFSKMHLGEDYIREVRCIPRVYEKYRNVVASLADNGANYLRTIMCPTSTDIEYENLGNYTNRLNMAYEMDKTLALVETKDVFLHWNFNIHFTFELNNPDNGRPYTFDATSANGVAYCYNSANNNGLTQANKPIDFFTDPESKKYHKQRLRYILSRWGYSTNIATFELMSEISQVGSNGPEEYKYLYGNNYTVFRDWQVEMGNYIKSFYQGKKHMLTCSYAGAKDADNGSPNGAGMNDYDDTYNNSCFDIMTSNVYDFQEPNGAKFFYQNTSEHMLNTQSQYSYILENQINGQIVPNIKPLFFSECDVIFASCDPFRIELKRSLWQSMFSGLAGGLSWDSWYFPEIYSTFGMMNNFISQFDLGANGFHPAVSYRNTAYYNNWDYLPDYKNNMGFDDDYQADLAYLRSGDKNTAIGIITNKTINPYTIGNQCIPWNWVNWHTPSTVSISNDNSDFHLKLRGLNFGEYEIRYYYPNNVTSDIHHSNAWGPVVPIDVDFVTTDPNKSFILFVARKINALKSDTLGGNTEDSLTNTLSTGQEELSSGIKIYPNPADEMIYLDLGDQSGTFQVVIEGLDGRVCENLSFDKRFMSIPIANLAPATYVIKVYADGTLQTQQKMIKL